MGRAEGARRERRSRPSFRPRRPAAPAASRAFPSRLRRGAAAVLGALLFSLVTHAAADTTAPSLATATPPAVTDRALVLTFDEALDEDSVPAADAFTVEVDLAARAIDSVAVAGAAVTLTLSRTTVPGETVKVSYAKPAANPLKDASNNEVAGFADRAVVNHTAGCTDPVPPGAVWSACLIVGKFSSANLGNLEAYGYARNQGPGALVPSRFEHGGTSYEIDEWSYSSSGRPYLRFVANPYPAAADWAFHDGEALDLESYGDGQYNSGCTCYASLSLNTTYSRRSNPEVGERVRVSLVDVVRPALESATVSRGALVLTYNEDLDTGSVPAPGDYTVAVGGAGVAVTGVTVSGAEVTLALATPVRAGQAVTLDYAAGANPVRDGDGHLAWDLDGHAVDNVTRPELDPAAPPAVTGRSLALTFREGLDGSSVPAAAAFTVEVDTAARTVSSVAVAGRRVTLTLAEATVAGEAVTVAYTKPESGALAGAFGNEVADFGATPVANRSAACPAAEPAAALWRACLKLGRGAGSEVGFGAGFGALAPAAVERGGARHEVAALALGSGGLALRFAADPGTAANGWVLQVGAASFTLGEATRDATTHRFTWSGGAPAWTAADAGDAVAVSLRDTGAPSLVSATVDRRRLVLSFDEALDETSVPAAGDFAVAVDAGAGAAPSVVAVDGATLVLTLAAAVGPGRAVTVSYTAGASPLRDADGNPAGDLDGHPVANVTPPALDPATPPAVTGKALVLTFDAALDEDSAPAAATFTVKVDGDGRTVSSVAVAGRTVTLGLARAAVAGEAVTVAYAKPASDPLAGASGHEVADFGATPAVNRSAACPLDQPAGAFWSACLTLGSGSGSTVGFGAGFGVLAPAAVERGGARHEVAALARAAGGFALRFAADPGTAANGWVLQVAGASFVLGEATRDTTTHRFTWSGAAPAWTAADAGDVVSVSLRDTGPPAFVSATFDRDRVALAFDEALDEDSVPAAGDFAVAVDAGAGAAPSRVAVSGATVTLTLAARVGSGRAVTVAYTAGATALKDLSGNAAASFGATAAAHGLLDCPAGVPANTFWRACLTVGRGATTTTNGYFDDGVPANSFGSLSPAEFERDGDRRKVEGLSSSRSSLILRFSGERRSAMNGWVLDVDGTALALGDATFNAGTRVWTWSSPGFAWGVADAGLKVPVGLRDAGGPVLESAAVDGGTTLVLTFDEHLDTGSAPAPGAWTVTVGGARAPVTAVNMIGATVTLALATPVGVGEPATVGYTAGARPLRDHSGNAAADFSARAVDDDREVALDPATPPAVRAKSLVLTFDGALDEDSVPAPGAFTVVVDTTPNAVSAVAVAGRTATLTLSLATVAGEAVTVAYEKPASDPLKNAHGRAAPGFGATAVANRSGACPESPPAGAFWTACLFAGASSGFVGLNRIASSGADFGSWRPASAGTFERGGAQYGVARIAWRAGGVVDLGFSRDPGAALAGWELRIGAVAFDLAEAVLHDAARHIWRLGDGSGPAAALAAWAAAASGDSFTVGLLDLRAPALASATVDRGALTLAYDEALDETSVPAPGDFTVTAGTAAVAVTGVSVSGQAVTLSLAPPVGARAAATVGYTAGVNPVRDTERNPAAGLDGRAVVNTAVPELDPGTPPAVTGRSLVLTFLETLDADSVPSPDSFTVKVGATRPGGSAVAIAGSTVTLTLSYSIVAGQAVTVAYTPRPGGVPLKDGASGSPAASFGATAVVNRTPACPGGQPADAFWSACLRVEARGSALGFGAGFGALAPAAFDRQGTRHEVDALSTVTGFIHLSFAADPGAALPGWTLQVGDDAFDLAGATVHDEATHTWEIGGVVAWSDGDRVPVSLRSNDAVAPALDPATPPAVDAKALVLTFDETLHAGSVPAPEAFTVTVDGTPATVSSVGVAGRAATLALAVATVAGETVTVRYEPPGSGALADSNGNEAAGFGPAPVANRSAACPAGRPAGAFWSACLTIGAGSDGGLGFDGSAGRVVPNAFVRRGAGYAVGRIVQASGGGLSLSFAPAAGTVPAGWVLQAGDRSFDLGDASRDTTDPAAPLWSFDAGPGWSASRAGDRLTVSLRPRDATRPALDEEAPPAVEGKSLALTFDAALDERTVPGTGAFSVRVDGAVRALSEVAVAGRVVTLTLAEAVAGGEAVTVSYARPALRRLHRADNGNEAAEFTGRTVANRSAACPGGQPADAFWSACLTIGSGSGGTVIGFASAHGALSTPAFTRDGTRHEVDLLVRTAAGMRLSFAADPGDAAGGWVLHAGAGAWDLDDAIPVPGSDHTLTLGAPNDWSAARVGDKVTVSLRARSGTPPVLDPAIPPAVTGRTLTLTFGEDLDAGSVPAADAFAVTVGESARPVSAVAVAGAVATLTLAEAVVAGEAVAVGYTPPVSDPLRDLDGNEAAGFAAVEAVNRSAACPASVPAGAFWSACLTLGAGEGRIGFSSRPGTAHGALSGASFERAGSGYRIDALGASAAGTVLSFAAAPGAAPRGWVLRAGELEWALAAATVADTGTHTWRIGAGEVWSAEDAGDKLTVSLRAADARAPVLASARVDGDALVLAYDEALDQGSVPAAGAYSVAAAGGTGAAPSRVEVAGSAVTLTLAAAVSPGDAVTVSYTAGARPVRDAAGNPAADLDARAAVNLTSAACAGESLPAGAFWGACLTVGAGAGGVTGYDATASPAFGALAPASLAPNGRTFAVDRLRLDGGRLELSFAAGAPSSDDTAGWVLHTGAATHALHGAAGHDGVGGTWHWLGRSLGWAATQSVTVALVATDVFAPALSESAPPAVDSRRLVLTFDEPLDATSAPAAGAFAVRVAGADRAVSAVRVAGRAVTLTLAAAAAAGETVTVGYTKPEGAGATPVRDAAGNPAESFAGKPVTNRTPASDPPPAAGVLVSNDAQGSATEEAQGANKWAQSFTTGANAAGYSLSGIALRLGAVPDGYAASDFEVSVWSATTAGTVRPDSRLQTLRTPGALSPGLNAFAASNLALARETTYFVVVDDGPGTVPIAETSTNGEDSGKASGWSLGNGYRTLSKSSDAWSGSTAATEEVKVKVHGRARVAGDPELRTATVNADVLSLTFSEALDEDSVPAAGDFTVAVGGAVTAVRRVAVSGSAVTLRLAAPARPGRTVTLSYVPGAAPLKDSGGNAAAGLDAHPVSNLTPRPPSRQVLVSNDAQSPATEAAQGANKWAQGFETGDAAGYVLTGVSLRLGAIPDGYAASDFEVEVWSATTDATPRPDSRLRTLRGPGALSPGLNAFAASNLTLAAETTYFVVIDDGAGTVPVARTSSNDEDPGRASGWSIADADFYLGKSIDAWSGAFAASDAAKVTVHGRVRADGDTAPELESATVDRDELVLAFDEALDDASTPAAGDFAVAAGDGAAAVAEVTVRGREVVLALAAPVAPGQAVTLSYTPGAAPVRDLTGNPAARLDAHPVVNATMTALAAGTPPEVSGRTLVLTFDAALATSDLPAPEAFTVTVDGASRAVSALAVDGAAATLTLSVAAVAGESVAVSYAKPAENPLKDAAGEDVAEFTAVPVANRSAACPAPATGGDFWERVPDRRRRWLGAARILPRPIGRCACPGDVRVRGGELRDRLPLHRCRRQCHPVVHRPRAVRPRPCRAELGVPGR